MLLLPLLACGLLATSTGRQIQQQDRRTNQLPGADLLSNKVGTAAAGTASLYPFHVGMISKTNLENGDCYAYIFHHSSIDIRLYLQTE